MKSVPRPPIRDRGSLEGWVLAVGIAAILMGSFPDHADAYETDQYSNRLTELGDAAPVLDRIVNEAIEELVARWPGGEDDLGFAERLYFKLGGPHWVDRIERVAMKSPEIEKLPQRRRQSVFKGAPVYATRVNFVFGVGRTISVGGTLVGSDKLGHFFSQGLKYYRRHVRGWTDQEVIDRGLYAERWLFGQATTGVFSNADLVSNYEGYLFYRSLFEDEIVPGKSRIVVWRKGYPTLARRAALGDHVNDFWDEAVHPSYLSPSLARFMTEKLSTFCPDYERAPERYVPRDEERLRAKYSRIGLKDATCYRLDHICADATEE